MPASNMSVQPAATDSEGNIKRPPMQVSQGHPEHNMPAPEHEGFESTMQVGDYAMPRAGKTTDYFTDSDKKANPQVK